MLFSKQMKKLALIGVDINIKAKLP